MWRIASTHVRSLEAYQQQTGIAFELIVYEDCRIATDDFGPPVHFLALPDAPSSMQRW